MFPVFSLVLDKDVKSEVAMLYPELYKDLLKVFIECSHPEHYRAQIYASNGKPDILFYFVFLTGPTTIVQDVSNMGPNKHLPRY